MLDDPQPTPPPSDGRVLVIAMLTTAATTLVAGLVTWWIDELRSKYGTKPQDPPKAAS